MRLFRYIRVVAKSLSMERLFQILSDRTRLRILNVIGDREICVCHFVTVLGDPQPKVSRHLSHLRANGLVSTRRDGKWVYYRIAPPANPWVARVLRETLAWMSSDPEMCADVRKLCIACGFRSNEVRSVDRRRSSAIA